MCHDDIDNCDCRKPKPGMLLQAAVKYNIDLAGSWMVGDRWKDVLAGKRAGCRTLFIDRGYTETQDVAADFNVSSLLEAAEIILGL
jgi:D-glycero-D-manno-heptose 1,7-bisphosphate phosphatase